jgi:ribonuclease-3
MSAGARESLETALGHRFGRSEQLTIALTHRSHGADEPNNEKLEFLGDAVLSLAMSDLLMARFPTAREGDLSKIRASLVNAEVLARKARQLDLGRWLRLGRGEEKSGGREKLSILASGYEALLGAIYVDAGYEAARAVVEAHFASDVGEHLRVGLRDYKTELQEVTQRLFRETPAYTLVEESGPDHDKKFVSEIGIGGRTWGRGVGRSKKLAEQAAAMEALTTLAREHPGTSGADTE